MTAPLKHSDPITVDVALGDRAYDIVIGRDVLPSLGARIAALRPRIDQWYIAPLPGPRGATAARVATALRQAGVGASSIHAFDDIARAFAAARGAASETDRIAAFGSFLTVAGALIAARERQ